ncbi:MAG: hypothetical protein CVU53_02860 [Deltaproteobacteria bacterium HGW-Deltaproteobacteria-11]|nr:MAG: hypothetical protein CVU53_02860 [Deltaproteobacteria bacterium HGW-Deltaproteobacteria-11]
MPRGDRTGPWGMGPMTGRGAGFCAGYSVPGFANAAPGGAFFGRGGRGRRNRFFATGQAGWMRGGMGFGPFGAAAPEFSPEEEIRQLRQEADYMEKTLSGIRDRIGRMEKESGA